MVELVANGRAARLVESLPHVMSANNELAGAVQAVLLGYLSARDPRKMTSDKAAGLADVLSTLTQNRGAGLGSRQGNQSEPTRLVPLPEEKLTFWSNPMPIFSSPGSGARPI
jgi:hypothetical protein